LASFWTVSNERSLWTLLREFPSAGGIGAINSDSVRFTWQPELLYFPHERKRTISPTIARSISGFHSALSRGYAALVYGEPNARLLHRDDEDVLDLQIFVRSGSSILQVEGISLDRLVKTITQKMTGRQITIAVIAVVFLYFSETVARDWIAREYAARTADNQRTEIVTLSEEETKRMELITKIVESSAALKNVSRLANESKQALARAVTDTDSARMLRIPITGEQARTILSKPRDTGIGRKLDGRYEVVEINKDNPDGFTAILRNVLTGEEFSASVNSSELTLDDLRALFDALRNKSAIDAQVNAFFLGDKITSAAVMRAVPTK
jgi:hypothetical protein